MTPISVVLTSNDVSVLFGTIGLEQPILLSKSEVNVFYNNKCQTFASLLH